MAGYPDADEARFLETGTLAGEYRITHKLGEGGMGIVYAAVHPEIGKRVAIKVLAPHAAAHTQLILRFKEEARAVNKIGHPNIIDIFAFNQLPDGRHYFVMEHLGGESLDGLIARGGLVLAEVRLFLRQICSALAAAHHAGVVHRDLKPENIWVAREGFVEPRVKLLDFGIAKLSDVTGAAKVTQAGVAMGTPHYMPPEQGLGRAVDHRADIYALGVILYELFAGTLPFNGPTAQEIIFKHVSEAPVAPSRHRPIVPRGMEAIILHCLQKNPVDRPVSMDALAQQIEAIFAAEGSTPGRIATLPLAPSSTGATVPTLLADAPQVDRTELLPTATQVAPAAAPEVGQTLALQPARTVELPKRTSLTGATGERVALARPRSRPIGWIIGVLGVGAAAGVATMIVRSGPRAPSGVDTPQVRPLAIPPADPPRPAEITIKLGTEPPGARVVRQSDKVLLGRTPYVESRSPHESLLDLVLELEGFESLAVRVPLKLSFAQTYRLERKPDEQPSIVVSRPSGTVRSPSRRPKLIGSHPTAAPTTVAPVKETPTSPVSPQSGPKKAPEIIEWKM